MLRKKFNLILFVFFLVICSLSAPAGAASETTLNLSAAVAEIGDMVTAFGTSDGDTWIAVKVLDNSENILYLNFVKSDAEGNYSCTFKVHAFENGILRVIGGYGSNVAKSELTVGGYYSVTYYANGGTGSAPTETDKAAGAEFHAATNTFVPPSGKQFKHWYTNAIGTGGTAYDEGDAVTMPEENLTLYAIWENDTAYEETSLSLNVTKQENSVFVEAQVSLEEPSGVLILALYDGDKMIDIFVDTDLPSVQSVSLSFVGYETSSHLHIKGFIWSSLAETKPLIDTVEHPIDLDGI